LIGRRGLSRGLVALASLLLLAATLAWYARAAVLDSGAFADRATAAVQDTGVRTLIADRVTDQVILRHRANLTTARPIISSAVAGIVGGGAFRSLFRRAVLDAHRAVLSRDQNTITLTLADVGIVAATALQKLSPALAAELHDSGAVTVLRRHLAEGGDLARTAQRLRALAYALAALTLIATAAALALSPDRRRTVAALGVGAIVVGVTIVAGLSLARGVALGHVSGAEERGAAGAIWDAYLADLRTWGWLLAGSGAVVAAAASSLIRPVALEARLRAGWRLAATEPARPAARLLRALALIAAGAVVVVEPGVALQVAATATGLYLAYAGVTALLRLISPPDERAPVLRPRRALAVPVLAVALVVAADAALVAGDVAASTSDGVAACNGADALCDRPLDEVVLAATHNSMSAPLKGWFASQQDRDIAGQLEDGIRGLLIDTHDADKLSNGRVRTHFASPADLSAAVKQDGLSQESYDAALRLRARAGFKGSGTRGIYLCHTFCELGATPLADGLAAVHDFLVTHPAQVLVVINQDYVTPADFVKAVDGAGLARYAFTPPSDSHWPTLRSMIDQDRRLVILAENHAGDAPWYQLAYRRLLQETPFSFSRPAQLADAASSCKANRGPAGAPLFLVNNWVTTDPVPLPSNAATVNAYDTLLARARACRRIRDHLPNLIAVDFYKRGDVFRVVDTLNGVRAAP
jgi:uncharacterized membrane protein HdeD (DUF308 family)